MKVANPDSMAVLSGSDMATQQLLSGIFRAAGF